MWLIFGGLALTFCWLKRGEIYHRLPRHSRVLITYSAHLLAKICNLPTMSEIRWPTGPTHESSFPARPSWDVQKARTVLPSINSTCPICDRAASKKCTRCKKVKYCSESCQKEHWHQGHREECQPASSPAPSDISPSRSPADDGQQALTEEQSPLVPQAPSEPPVDIGQPQLVELPCLNSQGQEQAPLASHVIFPYDGYLQLAGASNTRLPLGMMNCGNSCYAASVLQCLLQTSGITEYLARSFHSQRCTAPEHKWCLLCELQRLLNCPAVHTYQPPSFLRLNRSFSPSRACSVKPFIEHIEEIGPDFSSGQQEDAHEFFVQLLDRIESIMLAEAGGRRHFNHRSQETTLVNHAFSGYIRNQTMCRSCGHASKVFESCMSLPLELPEGIHSLEDALAAYMRQESLDGDNQYRCDRCDKNVDAVRSCRFEVLPNTLQICLKRFQVGFFGKISRHISFPGTLNLAPFRASGSIDGRPAVYILHSVIVHIGGASSYSYGHYICFIRSADNNWYKCDDDEVQRVDDSEVANSAAYMLFYQRAVPKPSPHELAHAASLQPIPAPVPLLRDVQAGNELGTKLKTAENHHYGKENISAAANAASQDTRHLEPDMLRSQVGIPGSATRIVGPADAALLPGSIRPQDGNATLHDVSCRPVSPAAAASPMQVPKFRIKPVLIGSSASPLPGVEVQVQLPGIFSSADVHAYSIKDCFALTAGAYHLELQLDAPEICLQDLKFQPRRNRLTALLTIPARPQLQSPMHSWGQHAAQQDMNAAESESLEHFLRDASPPPSSADLEQSTGQSVDNTNSCSPALLKQEGSAAVASMSQQVAREAGTAVQDDEEEIEEFEPIEKLAKLGINAGDIKKAKDGGFHTCQSLMMVTKKKLAEIKGLSDNKIEKMTEAAAKMCVDNGWKTASDVAVSREKLIVKITSGCTAVDEILGGGYETKSITEIYGEYRTGKTQICHTLCVASQMSRENLGGAGKVAIVDTEGTFRPERIPPIAERFGLDAEAVLSNIVCARAYTHEQQSELLVGVAALMAEEPFRMLIMDSITANFRVDFCGRGELADRQQKLGQLLAKLKKIADEFNVAVIITNQVMSDPSGGAMFVVDPKKPVGGHVMSHASTWRLSLRKGKGDQRVMKVVASPSKGEAEASYQIFDSGIGDYKD
ncbi:hypothetical protein WJX74_000796 [Apatococcus lobatus]|uniref:Ubiquitinyl hydrolase 1 n=1 Tax=Apatococcus lobatus TaxID=904363 RepID=A0AAW1RV44_9CHLO